MSHLSEIKKQINYHNRRLQKLKEQQALFGARTDPHILIEIEDIEVQLDILQKKLKELQEESEVESDSYSAHQRFTKLISKKYIAGIITVMIGIIATLFVQNIIPTSTVTPSLKDDIEATSIGTPIPSISHDINSPLTIPTTQVELTEESEPLNQQDEKILLDFEETYDCFPIKSKDARGVFQEITGQTGKAVELTYDLGNEIGSWIQIRCNFDPPLDLSNYNNFRFDWRGELNAANSLEVAFFNPGGNGDYIFGQKYTNLTHQSWWGQIIIPYDSLKGWLSETVFDPRQVSGFFITVIKEPIGDVGSIGSITIDNLSAFNIGSRHVPTTFETVKGNIVAATAAANWLTTRQKETGLLQSWEEESCNAWLYDQALALIVFTHEEKWSETDALIEILATLQNDEGSWYIGYNCATLETLIDHKSEHDIAWVIYALSRYEGMGGSNSKSRILRNRATEWLTTRIDSDTGCLEIDQTVSTLIAWWALQSTGANYADERQNLEVCLLTKYWDEELGIFKPGENWPQPFLDNQTIGATFLKAVGQDHNARRALSYARETFSLIAQGGKVFLLPTYGGQITGLRGSVDSGPIWNEGTAQYVAVGGEGANDLLADLLAQQQQDGGLPGSTDEFTGGGVWATRSAGVAPTAWLFFAICGGPFQSPVGGECK